MQRSLRRSSTNVEWFHGTVKNIRVMDSLGYSKEALTARQKYFSLVVLKKTATEIVRDGLDEALEDYPEKLIRSLRTITSLDSHQLIDHEL